MIERHEKEIKGSDVYEKINIILEKTILDYFEKK